MSIPIPWSFFQSFQSLSLCLCQLVLCVQGFGKSIVNVSRVIRFEQQQPTECFARNDWLIALFGNDCFCGMRLAKKRIDCEETIGRLFER